MPRVPVVDSGVQVPPLHCALEQQNFLHVPGEPEQCSVGWQYGPALLLHEPPSGTVFDPV
jgi:hypothetical protein